MGNSIITYFIIYVIFFCTSLVSAIFIVGSNIFGFQDFFHKEVLFGGILVFTITLIGAGCGVLHDAVASSKPEENWLDVCKKSFQSKRFGLTLTITPLILLFVFNQVDTRTIDASVLLYSFQSGFFWDKIAGTLRRAE